MKTYLTYGLAMAIAVALLTLGFYFLGFHEASKLDQAQLIGLPLILAISITCIVLGTKARREEVPPTEEFGYGRAFGAGFMITLFASLFSVITNMLYFGVINPAFTDVLTEVQLAKMEANGITGQALENAEKGMRFMMRPAILTIFGFFQSVIGGCVISLITAAFLKRPAVAAEPPPIAA